MFQVKINIYKLIKMLAKIKHDEVIFQRKLDTNSEWYKLSRGRVDYRQIAFDRRNRERRGLVDALDSNPPLFKVVPDTAVDSIGLPSTSKYYSGRWIVDNYPLLNGNISEWLRKNVNSNEYWREDVTYAWRYDCLNIWWFDLCLAPSRYELLLSETDVQSGEFSGEINRRIVLDYNPIREIKNSELVKNFYSYSPSRDLATNTFLQFASMQDNAQAFLHKMSYITAPYIPFVEQNKIFMAPLSKTVFDLRNPTDRSGMHANIYGIGNITDVFLDKAPSSIDRINRQKLFNDYFKALDSADWFSADKISDKLIQLTDGNGWAPYIGYGDLSLFIQRMNIPSEYIMTHALTDFQDEVLTNAYAINQLNSQIIDVVYQMQKEILSPEELIILDTKVATQDGYISNLTPYILYEQIVDSAIQLRNAAAMHIGLGGTITEAQNITANSDNFNEAVDILSSKGTETAINEQLATIDKIQKI